MWHCRAACSTPFRAGSGYNKSVHDGRRSLIDRGCLAAGLVAGCLLSSSKDNTLKVTDVDSGAVKQVLNQRAQGHTKGILGFEWCASYKIVATCGIERDIVRAAFGRALACATVEPPPNPN